MIFVYFANPNSHLSESLTTITQDEDAIPNTEQLQLAAGVCNDGGHWSRHAHTIVFNPNK